MCRGTPTTSALHAVSFNAMTLAVQDKPSVSPARAAAEEEMCGEVGRDGVRRFSYRRVLCRGAEVLVEGWLATVESIDMDAETVSVRYSTGGSAATVPLTQVRSVLVAPLNRDLQKGLASFADSVANFFDLKNWVGGCPIGLLGTAEN